MHIWRLCRRPFAKEPLSGKGCLVSSGRWHTSPRLVVYASESLALASLEILVHTDLDVAPADLVAIEIDIPAEVEIAHLTLSQLPRFWRRYPSPQSAQKVGNAWLDSRNGAVLRLPSAIIPSEHNFLINPLHVDAAQITIVKKRPFAFDPRLIARGRGHGQTTR
jgi:RES domain-containing protein